MTAAQWAVIEPLLPTTNPQLGGRPPVHSRRLIIDTILYALVSGCAWRLVPPDGTCDGLPAGMLTSL